MPYPVGVLIRTVQLPTVRDGAGGFASGVLRVIAAAPLRWNATGELILQTPIDVVLVNGAASVDLPIVQEGFLSLAGAEVVSFTYTFSLSVPADSSQVGDVTLALHVSGNGSPFVLEFTAPDQDSTLVVREFVPVAGLAGTNGTNGTNGGVGPAGPATTLVIGTVTSDGVTAAATLTGTAPDQVLNLNLPAGAPGQNATASGVKPAGTPGQYYTKISVTDFDAGWVTPPTMTPRDMPIGGTVGQFLVKTTAADRVTGWATVRQVPAVGTNGQVLTVVNGVEAWASPTVGGSGLPGGGAPGQIIRKISTTEGDAGWSNDRDVPAGGVTGQIIVKGSSAENDAGWATTLPLSALPISVPLMCVKVAGVWPARPSTNAARRVFFDGIAPYPNVVAPPSTAGMYEGDFLFDESAS